MIPRHSLFLCLFFASLTPHLLSQQPANSVQTPGPGGTKITTLETKRGKIKVYLPDDMAAGDTISGTVTSEPTGKNEKEKERNAGELNGYVIELENQKSPVSGGVMRRIILAPNIIEPSLILLDEKGKQVTTVKISVAPTPAATRPSNFVVGGVGQTGKPIVVRGPFDGDSANTSAKVGDSKAKVIAESPRRLVVESPRDVVGPTRIEVTENGATAAGQFRNLKIDLTAPKTSLLKGESTELHVQVNGLEGLSRPIQIQVQNQSPSTVVLMGGNVQSIQIQPGQVQTGGTFPWSTGVTGTGNGPFMITGTLPPGIFFAPDPSPPPSTTQPSPNPSPLSQPGDTIVTRPTGPPDLPPGGAGETKIEMIELQLQSNKPIAIPSPTVVAGGITEPEPPKITEPPLRPPSLPSPTPYPTRPPYVPAPGPVNDPVRPTIPGSGGLNVPKPPPAPPLFPPPSPSPTPCKCDRVDIKSEKPNELTVSPGVPVFDPPANKKQIGFKIGVITDFISHTIKCTGDPKSDPCRADVSWILDVEYKFTMNGANWVPGNPLPGLERATALNAITYKVLGKSLVKQITLEEKCLAVKGGTPGCTVTNRYSLNREFQIKYPQELVDAIQNRKPNAKVNFGDIEIKITMSATVSGCKSTLEGADNNDQTVTIGRTWTIKNPHLP
jgi:hypothetical protein